LGVPGPVHAIAVSLPRRDAGQKPVPDIAGALGQIDDLLVAGAVEKAQLDAGGDFGKEREIGARAVVRGAHRVGPSRPDLHRATVAIGRMPRKRARLAAETPRFAASPPFLSSPAPAMIASAAALKTAGFIEVSRPRWTASADAPDCPLLKCRFTDQCREASNSAAAKLFAFAPSKRSIGTQRD